jgi:branched-chain amino acid transport system substrate-binding protein
LALAVGCSQRGTPESLWLGQVAPMTGTDKSIGDHARQGASIAVSGLNTPDNLVLAHKVMIRQADAKSAEAEAVRLVGVNRVVGLLGGTDSAQAEQLARGAESAGVPVVLQAPVPMLGERGFSIVPSLSRRGQVLAKFVREKKLSKVAVILDERISSAGPVADAIAGEFPKGSVVRVAFKSPEEMPAVAVKIADAKPQAAVFVGSAQDALKWSTQMKKSLPNVALFYGGDESGLSALLGDRAAGEDFYVITSYLAADETAENQSFVKNYQEQYSELPDVNSALAYDATRLLAEAIRTAGSINPVKVRDALSKLDTFPSVTGALTFGTDHHAVRPLFVVQIKNGQAVLQRRYDAEE